jgi:hypothetical protein
MTVSIPEWAARRSLGVNGMWTHAFELKVQSRNAAVDSWRLPAE